jgi:phosphate transport system protein
MGREDLERRMTRLRESMTATATLVDDLLDRAIASVQSGDAYDARMAISREDEMDRACGDLEEQTIDLLTLQQPVLANDLRLVVATLVVAQRLQRVGHGALGVARLAVDLADLGSHQPPPPELLTLAHDGRLLLHDAVQALSTLDRATAAGVVARDTQVDAAYRTLREDLLQRLGTSPTTQDDYHRRLTFWLWIAHKLERVADHGVIIAKRVEHLG